MKAGFSCLLLVFFVLVLVDLYFDIDVLVGFEPALFL